MPEQHAIEHGEGQTPWGTPIRDKADRPFDFGPGHQDVPEPAPSDPTDLSAADFERAFDEDVRGGD